MRTTAGNAADAMLLTARVRWAAFAVLTALVAAGGVASQQPAWVVVVSGTVGVAMAAGLLFAPWGRPWGYGYVGTATVAVLGHGSSSNVGWFAVCVFSALIMLTSRRVVGVIHWAGLVVLFGVEYVAVLRDAGWFAWLAGVTFTALMALLVRQQVALVAQLRAAQHELEERSRADERNAIARELHDVIGHSLTITLMHLTGARLALDCGAPDAPEAVARAEELARQTLNEVRGVVGMLTPDAAPADKAHRPLPGAADLPALVERYGSAGADIALTIHGDLGQVPATTGLAAYRIAQEALTNAAKHAPGAPVSVQVQVRDGQVTLEVESAGAVRPGAVTGHGVAGMQERAASLRGSLWAGPAGNGWLVTARLPLAGLAAERPSEVG